MHTDTITGSKLDEYLGDRYPASREDVVTAAIAHGAHPAVVRTLMRLPRGRYESAQDILEHVGAAQRTAR
jgi:hypothetical protein